MTTKAKPASRKSKAAASAQPDLSMLILGDEDASATTSMAPGEAEPDPTLTKPKGRKKAKPAEADSAAPAKPKRTRKKAPAATAEAAVVDSEVAASEQAIDQASKVDQASADATEATKPKKSPRKAKGLSLDAIDLEALDKTAPLGASTFASMLANAAESSGTDSIFEDVEENDDALALLEAADTTKQQDASHTQKTPQSFPVEAAEPAAALGSEATERDLAALDVQLAQAGLVTQVEVPEAIQALTTSGLQESEQTPTAQAIVDPFAEFARLDAEMSAVATGQKVGFSKETLANTSAFWPPAEPSASGALSFEQAVAQELAGQALAQDVSRPQVAEATVAADEWSSWGDSISVASSQTSWGAPAPAAALAPAIAPGSSPEGQTFFAPSVQDQSVQDQISHAVQGQAALAQDFSAQAQALLAQPVDFTAQAQQLAQMPLFQGYQPHVHNYAQLAQQQVYLNGELVSYGQAVDANGIPLQTTTAEGRFIQRVDAQGRYWPTLVEGRAAETVNFFGQPHPLINAQGQLEAVYDYDGNLAQCYSMWGTLVPRFDRAGFVEVPGLEVDFSKMLQALIASGNLAHLCQQLASQLLASHQGISFSALDGTDITLRVYQRWLAELSQRQAMLSQFNQIYPLDDLKGFEQGVLAALETKLVAFMHQANAQAAATVAGGQSVNQAQKDSVFAKLNYLQADKLDFVGYAYQARQAIYYDLINSLTAESFREGQDELTPEQVAAYAALTTDEPVSATGNIAWFTAEGKLAVDPNMPELSLTLNTDMQSGKVLYAQEPELLIQNLPGFDFTKYHGFDQRPLKNIANLRKPGYQDARWAPELAQVASQLTELGYMQGNQLLSAEDPYTLLDKQNKSFGSRRTHRHFIDFSRSEAEYQSKRQAIVAYLEDELISRFEVELYSQYPDLMPTRTMKKNSLSYMRKLHELNFDFVFFDTETTGMDRAGDRPERGHRVITFGMVPYEDGHLLEQEDRCFNYIFNPDGQHISEMASDVHGIKDGEVIGKPHFRDVVRGNYGQRLLDTIAGKILIAHNSRFDLSFLNQELRLCNAGYELQDVCLVIDSLELAREILVSRSYSLDALSDRFNVKIPRDFHGALLDSIILGHVYTRMYSEVREELEVTNSVNFRNIPEIPPLQVDHDKLRAQAGAHRISLTRKQVESHQAFISGFKDTSRIGIFQQVQAEASDADEIDEAIAQSS